MNHCRQFISATCLDVEDVSACINIIPYSDQSDRLAYSVFDRSLNASLCEIYVHKAALLLVKTVIHKSSISMYGKDVPIL